jgi:hypothetical protein
MGLSVIGFGVSTRVMLWVRTLSTQLISQGNDPKWCRFCHLIFPRIFGMFQSIRLDVPGYTK